MRGPRRQRNDDGNDSGDDYACSYSLDYIREIAGCRTVPVEVGSRYTDEDWSQTLMTVSEFIHKYIESEVRRGLLFLRQ